MAQCARHRAVAAFQCTVCEALLCCDCTASRRVGYTSLTCCLICRELANPLTVHRRERASFLQMLPAALIYPFRPAGLMGMAGLGLVRAVLIFGGLFGAILGWGLLCGVVFHWVRASARGDDDAVVDFQGVWEHVLAPLGRFLAATLVIWLPAVIYIIYGRSTLRGAWADPVVWLLVAAGWCYAPMAMLVAATGTPLLRIFNPLTTLRYLAILGWDYVWLVGALSGLVMVWPLAYGFGLLVSLPPVPILAPWVEYSIASYIPFVAGRVLGLLLYVRGDELGYGLESDYQVPLVPGARPRGVWVEAEALDAPRARSHAPIELSEDSDPSEGFGSGAQQLMSQHLPARQTQMPRLDELGAHVVEAEGPWQPPAAAMPRELDASALPSAGDLYARRVKEAFDDGDNDGALDAWWESPVQPLPGLGAETLLHLGRAAAAKDDQPSVAKVKVLLARWHDAARGDRAEAERLLRDVVEKFPGSLASDVATRTLLGWSGGKG